MALSELTNLQAAFLTGSIGAFIILSAWIIFGNNNDL